MSRSRWVLTAHVEQRGRLKGYALAIGLLLVSIAFGYVVTFTWDESEPPPRPPPDR